VEAQQAAAVHGDGRGIGDLVGREVLHRRVDVERAGECICGGRLVEVEFTDVDVGRTGVGVRRCPRVAQDAGADLGDTIAGATDADHRRNGEVRRGGTVGDREGAGGAPEVEVAGDRRRGCVDVGGDVTAEGQRAGSRLRGTGRHGERTDLVAVAVEVEQARRV